MMRHFLGLYTLEFHHCKCTACGLLNCSEERDKSNGVNKSRGPTLKGFLKGFYKNREN